MTGATRGYASVLLLFGALAASACSGDVPAPPVPTAPATATETASPLDTLAPSSDGSETSTLPPLPTAPVLIDIDLCALFPKADAETAMGHAVGEPSSTGSGGGDVFCTYHGEPEGYIQLHAGRASDYAVLEQAYGSDEAAKPIDDIGDAAVFVPSVGLIVSLADQEFFLQVFIATGAELAADETATLDAARVIIERL